MRALALLWLLTGLLQAQPPDRRLVQVTSDPPGARVFADGYQASLGSGYLGVTPCSLWLDSGRSYELFLVADGYLTARYRLAPLKTRATVRLEPSSRLVLWPLALLGFLPVLWFARGGKVVVQGEQAELAGEYELLDLLGEGSSARVYRARHRDYGDEFALKLWRSDSLDPAALERFRREVEVGCRLHHPHLLRIMACGLCDRGAFVVSELLQGETLQARLDRGPVEAATALEWLEEIARGLEALHDAGLVHRDLKPANLMLSPEGRLKLLDFGMVRDLDAASTLPGGAVGTPHFMAPEMMTGEAGPPADLYSLGVIAYRLFSGQLLFPEDDPVRVMAAQLYAPPPELSAGPPALQALVGELLDKLPERRPTASQCIQRLEELRHA